MANFYQVTDPNDKDQWEWKKDLFDTVVERDRFVKKMKKGYQDLLSTGYDCGKYNCTYWLNLTKKGR